MTEMKRVTVSLPEEIDKKVLELRKDERFIRCSYSEIVRKLLEAGGQGGESVNEKKKCSTTMKQFWKEYWRPIVVSAVASAICNWFLR